MAIQQKTQNSGFTLIEVLVAVGILAIFASVIYSSFFGTMRIIRETEELTDSFQPARLILDRITRDLKGAVHILNDPRYIFSGIDSYDGDPNHDRLDFTTNANVIIDGDTPQSDLAEISYYIDRNHTSNGYLVRRANIYPNKEPDKGGELKIIAENITGLNFKYFLVEQKTDDALLTEQEKKEQKKSAWELIEDPENWKDYWDWKEHQFIPIMVKVELSLRENNGEEASFSTVVFLNRDPDTFRMAPPVSTETDTTSEDRNNNKSRDPDIQGGSDNRSDTDRPRIDKPIIRKDEGNPQ
jgi:prepilin-type N-terminal cleavage/methylation domain-containing protein